MIFVALDLETTWLDPKTDTIIEIAAIRFELKKRDGKFLIINSEERTMLIDPDRELKEEVTMITGITREMLEWREKWGSVRERVRDFIGDAIIVGHNVLFDIAMLGTHGIDISGNITIDTFELSEIFSQDVESLNLLFLATHYGIPIEWEHRALDDTRLSVWLFIHYLESILTMGEEGKKIFSFFLGKDSHKIIETLTQLCELENISWYCIDNPSQISEKITNNTFHTNKIPEMEYRNLSGEIWEELEIIEKAKEKYGKILLITNGKKQSLFWKEKLNTNGYKAELIMETKRYCSLNTLESFIQKSLLQRKELIFSIKMLFWLQNTKTGLLDELKYYGEEREWMEFFRLDESEYSHFQEKQKENALTADILIGDPWIEELQKSPFFWEKSCTIVRDIIELEDTFRKSGSRKISFLEIENDIAYLYGNWILSENLRERTRMSMAYFQYLIENLQERPEWPSPIPPGDYGETYYFDQEDLWNHGNKWILLFMNNLRDVFSQEAILSKKLNGIDKKILQRLLRNIRTIQEITHFRNTNLWMIISILENNTILTIIPRDTSPIIENFLNIQSGEKIILTGYGIWWPIVQSFLRNECHIHWKNSEERKEEHLLQVTTNHFSIIEKSLATVILSTSNKHLRSLSKDIQKRYPEIKVFTQWISGGKWKMLSMYEKYDWKKILIGLIDSWIDESIIWQKSDTVILGKMPFDPPSDPYYLARTIGMKNNFEEYGCPLAIAKINTLVGRIRNVNEDAPIYCLDERLTETIWWQKLYKEIL